MSTDSQRTCPNCGNEFSGTMEFRPVCMLRGAIPGAAESGASSFEGGVKATSEQPVQRFDHYELVTAEDGKPVELGRGAMGVTYKAFDINRAAPSHRRSSVSGTSVMNRRGFAFCVKLVQRRASVTLMLPRFSTWAEPVRITSTRWSL
jgi:hypothetical protein